jgi:hypothetical protein
LGEIIIIEDVFKITVQYFPTILNGFTYTLIDFYEQSKKFLHVPLLAFAAFSDPDLGSRIRCLFDPWTWILDSE